MYKEVVKNERNPILLILALVGSVFVAAAILDLLVRHDMIRDILLFIVLAYLIFFLVRYYLCTYQYSIIGRDLIFRRILRGREQLILNVSMDNLVAFYPYGAKELEAYKTAKKYTLCISKHHKQQYVGVFSINGAPVRIVFEPTSKLVSIIRQEIAEKQ